MQSQPPTTDLRVRERSSQGGRQRGREREWGESKAHIRERREGKGREGRERREGKRKRGREERERGREGEKGGREGKKGGRKGEEERKLLMLLCITSCMCTYILTPYIMNIIVMTHSIWHWYKGQGEVSYTNGHYVQGFSIKRKETRRECACISLEFHWYFTIVSSIPGKKAEEWRVQR